MTTIRQPLDRPGYVAVIVEDDTERPPYVAPPIPHYEHATTCGCENCRRARVLERKSLV